jgi:2'-5' RNA ligase
MPLEPQFNRLFIALAVPGTVKSKIQKVQNELVELLPKHAVRWTHSEHFHLTLRFLGNVATAHTNDLTEKLRAGCDGFLPLQLRAERIGFFPERGYPRVLWTAVIDTTQQLARLQKAVQGATVDFTSEPVEKEFTGHITLGRAKQIRRKEADSLTNFAARKGRQVFGEWIASSVELLRSELLPEGARHTVVTTIPLSGTK